MFTIEYDLTERTVQQIDIKADSLEDAKRLVEEYEFDNSEAREVNSLEWSLDNVREPQESEARRLYEQTGDERLRTVL
jgi:hypothetical protein